MANRIYGPYPAKVVDWHDGDTAHLDIVIGFGHDIRAYNVNGEADLSCRIFGINAPELRTPEGKAALAYANEICPAGTWVTLYSHNWDKYGGRYDGELVLPNSTIFATRMIAAGHAVAYKV